MGYSGYFIAIEGADGSGKGTHTELLRTYIESLKKNVLKLSFPRYGNYSAEIIAKYLNGGYGEARAIPADMASLPYALDRYAASSEIRFHLESDNAVVLTDRYVGSNLAHQGTKFETSDERRAFYKRMMAIEYDLLGIPRPHINIVLLMPSHLAQQNIDKKDASIRSYTDKKRDIHEADASHLDRARANYEELCELYPEEFVAVACTDSGGSMRTINNIQAEIRNIIKLA